MVVAAAGSSGEWPYWGGDRGVVAAVSRWSW